MISANIKKNVVMPTKLPQGNSAFSSAYSKFSLILLAITFISLLPHYQALLANPRSVSPYLVVHGILFLGWYILFSVQSGLVASRQVGLHMKLGYWSIALVVALVLSGTFMLIGTMKSFQPDWNPQYLMSRTSFVWAIIHTLVSFVCFYTLAIVFRRTPQTHKRLMLLAALSMMSASITRFAYLPIIPIDGTAFTLLFTYVLLITPLVLDRVQRKKVHPVLKWGVPIYAVSQLLFIGLIPGTAIGRAAAFPF